MQVEHMNSYEQMYPRNKEKTFFSKRMSEVGSYSVDD